MELTVKQKRFCDEYIKCGNAIQAAKNAGYKDSTAREASKWINPNDSLKNPTGKSKYNPKLREYIDKRMAKKDKKMIADQDEVLEYLTRVLRGESTSSEIVVESVEYGISEAREIYKAPSEKDRLKAADLLCKVWGTSHKAKIDIRRLEMDEERLEMDKTKAEMSSPDKEIKVVIAGYEDDWTE